MAKKKSEIPQHEQVILEPELEEALKNATDAEMCDIAGETNRFWIILSGSWPLCAKTFKRDIVHFPP